MKELDYIFLMIENNLDKDLNKIITDVNGKKENIKEPNVNDVIKKLVYENLEMLIYGGHINYNEYYKKQGYYNQIDRTADVLVGYYALNDVTFKNEIGEYEEIIEIKKNEFKYAIDNQYPLCFISLCFHECKISPISGDLNDLVPIQVAFDTISRRIIWEADKYYEINNQYYLSQWGMFNKKTKEEYELNKTKENFHKMKPFKVFQS